LRKSFLPPPSYFQRQRQLRQERDPQAR